MTKEDLAREAKVSHATVHRATDICAERNAHIARPVLRTPGEVRQDAQRVDIRAKFATANATMTQLNGKLDALAAVTTNLYHENQALHRQLDQRGKLTVLPRRPRPRRRSGSTRRS
jgi:hypothetical protein